MHNAAAANAALFLSRHIESGLCRILIRVILATLIFISSKPLLAVSDSLSYQRQQFAEFTQKIATSKAFDHEDMVNRLAELKQYPLYPYAQKYWMLTTLNRQSDQAMQQFLTAHDSLPVTWNVRKQWLQLAMDQGKIERFIAFYHPGLSAELDCFYLRQTLSKDVTDAQLNENVIPLWLVAFSQPKACDPLFSRWRAANLQTDSLTYARMVMAIKEGNLQLGRYLSRSLPSHMQYLAKMWRDAYRAPHRLTRMSLYENGFPEYESQVFFFAMSKLLWRDPDAVIIALKSAQHKLTLSEKQQRELTENMALSLAVDGDDRAELWLEKSLEYGVDPEIERWYVSTKLREQNWQGVLDILQFSFLNEQNPSSGISSAQHIFQQYWKGRSLEKLQSNGSANEWLNQVASERHYYGFLASARLQKSTALNHIEVKPDPNVQNSLLNNPSLQRAFELFYQNRFSEARREWRHAMDALNREEQIQAMLLAYEREWFDRAIFGLSELGESDDVVRRFPIAFSERINASAKTHNIDPAWAYAITRRESSFMVDAISSAGARGLMQILPSTAEYLTNRRMSYSALLDANNNIELGIQYWRYLLDKVDNNPVLAAASYNAGWRNVMNWLPAGEPIDMDIWIETIPYRETRNYVKAVLAYSHIYQIQLGQSRDIFSQLVDMRLSSMKLGSLNKTR